MITVQKQQRYSTETQQNCNWVTKQSKAKKHKRPNLENVTPVIFRLLFITQVWMNPKMMYRLLGCENGIVVGGVQNTGRGRFDGQHHSLLCKDLQIIEQNMVSPIALPVPFHIFSVLLLLVNATSLLNPTSLAFMTASTMTSWPTKGWYMHSSYCNLQRVYSCCIFGLKKNIHSFCISCSLFLLSWWGVAFHCHFLIVSFATFPGRVIISCFIIEWKNARIQCRVSACLTLLSELELKLQSFCDKRTWAMSITHMLVIHNAAEPHVD